MARLLSRNFPGKNTGLSFPTPGDLSQPGIKPGSPVLQADSYPLSHQGSPRKFLLWCFLKSIPSCPSCFLNSITSYSLDCTFSLLKLILCCFAETKLQEVEVEKSDATQIITPFNLVLPCFSFIFYFFVSKRRQGVSSFAIEDSSVFSMRSNLLFFVHVDLKSLDSRSVALEKQTAFQCLSLQWVITCLHVMGKENLRC